jgi:hypothetical protein
VITWGAAEITAAGTAIAAVLGGLAAVVKIVLSRPRLPVAEELLEQLDEMRDDLLALAKWAHRARAQAAAEGLDLEEPPDVLRSAGRRDGERRHDPATTGWRSSVTAQSGEQPVVQADPPMKREEAQTWPERRRPRLPPPAQPGRHRGPGDTTRIPPVS